MTTPETYKRGDGTLTLIRMQKIIEFVRDFHKQKGFAPTLKEIAKGIGMHDYDSGNISPLVKALIEQGFLENAGRHQARSLKVSKKPPRRVFYKHETES